MEFLSSPEFWIALGQIIIIDILLGGDNAVVIALACRKLPPAQRNKGIFWGTAGAIVLRVVLIAFAMTLLALPFLKVVGALLLVWIGVKLLAPDEEGHGNVEGSDKLLAAIKTIIVADLVMSVDNVIAIAGAAQNAGEHQMLLVVLGLLDLHPHHRVGQPVGDQADGPLPDGHYVWRHAAGLVGSLAACWSTRPWLSSTRHRGPDAPVAQPGRFRRALPVISDRRTGPRTLAGLLEFV